VSQAGDWAPPIVEICDHPACFRLGNRSSLARNGDRPASRQARNSDVLPLLPIGAATEAVLVGPSPDELLHYLRARRENERVDALFHDYRADYQFCDDCHTLMEEEVRNAGNLVKNYMPIAPLIRLGRQLGIRNLRVAKAWFSANSGSHFALKLSVREVPERQAKSNQRIAEELRLQRFGLAVLAAERQGHRRWQALQLAGSQVRYQVASRRSLEKKFREFEARENARGFVRDNLFYLGLSPQFGIAELKPQMGRTPKSASKLTGDEQANCLVFPIRRL
jgi:hypothetical protein